VFGVILGTASAAASSSTVGARRAQRHRGEWGHNPLPWPGDDERPGAACYCGRRGCIETFLSGPGFERDHRDRSGRDLATAQIVEQAGAGEPEAARRSRVYEGRLARALAHVINLLDPDVVVLGGGMSNTASLYAAVPKLWGAWGVRRTRRHAAGAQRARGFERGEGGGTVVAGRVGRAHRPARGHRHIDV
jgi:predicted NBD/HSP70 family sugar kinase